jgi:hypothetical protein
VSQVCHSIAGKESHVFIFRFANGAVKNDFSTVDYNFIIIAIPFSENSFSAILDKVAKY